ncbi:hypothetical protein FACS189459_2150 [Bacilli bacterium]|nr:hypothetical protein FACS189459_2150 [Bacilli bacterium]
MHSMYVKNYNTLPIKIIPNSTNDSDIANGGNVECLKTTANNIFLTQHDFDKNIFSSNPLYSMIIAFGVILLCVGIIISVLYRIPGLLSFIFLLLSFTTTLFILIYAGYTLSFGVIMGLFIGFCIAFISYFSIFSYIKKHFNSSHNYMLSIKKAIKEKIFKIFDINIIIFLLGICFTYFGTSELSPFGMSVIISVSIFIGVGLIL